MSPSALVAVEFALVIAVVVGFGVWQLVSVRREIARDREQAKRKAAEAADAAAPPADAPASERDPRG